MFTLKQLFECLISYLCCIASLSIPILGPRLPFDQVASVIVQTDGSHHVLTQLYDRFHDEVESDPLASVYRFSYFHVPVGLCPLLPWLLHLFQSDNLLFHESIRS